MDGDSRSRPEAPMRKDSNQPVHSDGYDRGDHEDTTTKRAMMEGSAKPKGTWETEEDVVVAPKSKRKAFWRRLANAKRRILSKMDSKSGFGVSATIAVVQIGVFIYDVLTYPIYTLLQRPWTNLAKSKRKRARVTQKDEDSVTYRSGIHMKELQLTLKDEGVTTMVGVLAHAVKTHRNKPVLGMRRLIKEEGEKQPDGRVFQKFVLGDYEWTTYNELDSMSTAFGAGLIACGQRVRHNVVILAETRSEWLVAAYGCMKYNIPIVTLYATLGEEAIAHGINETEVTHIVTSHELLPKFKKVLESTPRVTNVIYMEHQLQPSNTDGYKPGVTFTSFKDVVERGKTSPIDPAPPSPMDTAIIMYTSGSTGTPKGVVLTHSNMVASLVSFSAQLDFYPNDVYMGFLPLAHVLELLAESVCMLVGIQIGYSSPLTITDNSSKIMRGSKGDASVLRPTIMASVPLILDRIYKAIIDKVKKESALTRAVIKFAYDYKRRWTSYGYSTPLIDKLIFKKFRGVIGGRLRGMAVGGAPLSPETQDFIKTCLSCKVVQGYGLTESTAAATLQDWDDMNLGAVGSPLACCDIKLVSWEEGNYRVHDKPNPRGEIHIGGDNVSMGYYKNPAKTEEDFYQTLDTENGGVRRWFKTGDIGEMLPEGIVRIIDRKKDLLKLQHGEYISLGKVETELSTLPVVENICIYGDSSKLFTVALVVPNEKQLQQIAAKVGAEGAYAELCTDSKVVAEVLKELQAHGKKCRLQKFEIPEKLTLCSEMWTPDNSLVTAAFKLRRLNIEKHYREDINRMYAHNG